jgi:lipoic acid synthetase
MDHSELSRPLAPARDEPIAAVAPVADAAPLHVRKPDWLKTPIPSGDTYLKIKRDLRERKLFTVCEEAKCPNIGACWNHGTATFMVLGDTCTRACRFCNVKTGDPAGWLDPHEAEQTAQSVRTMALRYAVITMVDRDDLPDGGAAHVGEVIRRVRAVNPTTRLEILAGDFRKSSASLRSITDARPEVFAHNLETVRRLTPRVRDARANYQQSLEVLRLVKDLAEYPLITKSALMLGLGETLEEVEEALVDMRAFGVDFVTIGQYMRPTKQHLSIKRWVPPAEFDQIAAKARGLGFRSVVAGPLDRSSYRAADFYEQAMGLAPPPADTRATGGAPAGTGREG